MSARPSGLTWIFPAPVVSAASSASVAGAGMLPAKPGSGRCQDEPTPNVAAAPDSPPGVSRRDRPANAVSQPRAKSALNGGCAPSPWAGGWLVNVSPPTSLAVVHGTGAPADSPVPSRAAVDTIVNACPGG